MSVPNVANRSSLFRRRGSAPVLEFIKVLLTLLLFFPGLNHSAAFAKGSSVNLSPEALGAKAFLEDLLVRRYSQELGTKIERQSFSIGASLDVTEVKPALRKPDAAEPEPEPISDLMLGTLDPETLLKKEAPGDARDSAQGFLRNYKIKAVTMSVGLKEELGPDVKAEVEKWLNTRLQSEFGKAGKGVVEIVKIPGPAKKLEEKKADPAPKAPKTPMDWLDQFQELAGQALLVLGLLLGALLWKILSSKSNVNVAKTGDGQSAAAPAASAPAASAGEGAADEAENLRIEKIEDLAGKEIETLTIRLTELLPRIAGELESVVRSWCQMGEAGKIRLACFAEAVGRDVGKLPIPVDAMDDVSKVFAKMTDMKLSEKKDALQKAYWDFLTALNLGAEVLAQPFGYLGGMDVGLVNQVLIDQNSRMKTLVSLYLPPDLRSRYIKMLDLDKKRELLDAAAGLREIGSSELKSLDNSILSKLKPADNKNVIPLTMTLNKIVEALTPLEEITLLSQASGEAINEFKKSTPSLAFLHEWQDAPLSILLGRATADEVSSYLRVRPELTARFVALGPPLTIEMVQDELRLPDRLSEKDKNVWLGNLVKRLKQMVQLGEIVLNDAFIVGDNKAVESIDQTDVSKTAA